MTPERYQALLRWLEARPALKKLVIALNRWLPAVPFACYPLLLVLLNVRWFRLLSANRAAALDFMQLIARAVFVPAFVFLGGTLLRARLNFPRPYEQPGFTPLVPKETHGQSFPSRHALSAAVLAQTEPTMWAAWGTLIEKRDYLPGLMREMVALTREKNIPWVTFGRRSKKGHPHHPLYLRKDSTPEPFDVENYLDTCF